MPSIKQALNPKAQKNLDTVLKFGRGFKATYKDCVEFLIEQEAERLRSEQNLVIVEQSELDEKALFFKNKFITKLRK